MKSDLLTFFIKLTIITGIAVGAYAFLIFQVPWPRASYDAPIFLFLYCITLLIYVVLRKAATLKPEAFVQILMLSFVVKILLCGVFCFIIIYTHYEGVEPNIWLFFALYLVYTFLEIFSLSRVISTHGKACLSH